MAHPSFALNAPPVLCPGSINGAEIYYPDTGAWVPTAPMISSRSHHAALLMADGTVMAKVAWTVRKNPAFPVALEPDRFVQVEFMIKDAKKYAATGGWGFARFLGPELKPYGKDAGFVQECFGCHTPVKENDYVFTHRPAYPE